MPQQTFLAQPVRIVRDKVLDILESLKTKEIQHNQQYSSVAKNTNSWEVQILNDNSHSNIVDNNGDFQTLNGSSHDTMEKIVEDVNYNSNKDRKKHILNLPNTNVHAELLLARVKFAGEIDYR
ncbi:hypothetical protein ACH5RR_021519 [Cinchona calisaya]|uniref:Uncharacterized protein n=1 Tax=Cinchona calisaya TaxID=153742 RepID=A0ABD2ZHJ0_9GENT